LLREVWASCWRPPLLPRTPSAHVGSMIHALLEAAGKGEMEDGSLALVETRWADLLGRTEQTMSASWIEKPLQPLSLSVPDFEVRRIRAFERAVEIARTIQASRQRRTGERGVGNELPVSSPEGLVAGYVDCAVETRDGIVLRDYKTGAITEDNSSSAVKTIYQVQLRLYAALYYSSFGRWPTRLELVPLRGDPIAVSFSPDECLSLLRDATDLLKHANTRIEQVDQVADRLDALASLAAPRPSSCRYCLYRPACPAYREARAGPVTDESWPTDVLGQVIEIRMLGNGRLNLSIADPGLAAVARVRGIDPDPARHPALLTLEEGSRTAICNLRPSGAKEAFSELMSTVIYVNPPEGMC